MIWGVAFNAPLARGRLIPTFEILGRTVLDAVDPGEEGSSVELGGGVWWLPFAEGSALEPLSLGVAAKGPVTDRRESHFSTLLVLKYEFE